MGRQGVAKMENIAQLRQSAIEKLNRLPGEKLVVALDFIDFLMLRQAASADLPAPDAFVECAGTWEFEPGELEEILQDIERSRLMEIEEQRGDLLA
jgi:hypothetical protein